MTFVLRQLWGCLSPIFGDRPNCLDCALNPDEDGSRMMELNLTIGN